MTRIIYSRTSIPQTPVRTSGEGDSMEQSLSTTGVASRTAMMTATLRGWHLMNAGANAIGPDWLAWPLVGGEAEGVMAALLPVLGEAAQGFPAWLCARAQVAEDWLAESGAEQLVVLGAGLDTFAWRTTQSINVFEVDHPATQQWKRDRIAALNLTRPERLTWVPVDFERDSLADGLAAAGLGAEETFVSWLGVLHYLTPEAIKATLDALPPCTLAANYVPPRDGWPIDAREFGDRALATVQAAGEAFLSLYHPAELAQLLSSCGFDVIEDFGPEHVESRYGHPVISFERIALARKVL